MCFLLQAGTIPPEYIDRRQAKEDAAAAKKREQEQAERAAADHADADPERQMRLKEKVCRMFRTAACHSEQTLSWCRRWDSLQAEQRTMSEASSQACPNAAEQQQQHCLPPAAVRMSVVEDTCCLHPLQVEEMKASLARKEAARARYQEHMAAQRPVLRSGTDYTKWELFTPEDEEDEMVNSLTPNDPGIRALEKDINERHQR